MRIPLATTATLLLTAVLLLPVTARAGGAHREVAVTQEPEEICEALPDDVPIEQTVLGHALVSVSSQPAQRWTLDATRVADPSSDRARR
jgi:hypothetical protein